MVPILYCTGKALGTFVAHVLCIVVCNVGFVMNSADPCLEN